MITIGGPVRAIAHRGDWADSRENTLPAVASAIRAGADLVEIDVKVTADGQVVLLHDLGLSRLWNDDRRVSEVTSSELAAVSTGGLTIPALLDVLALVGGTGTGVLIDLDSDEWAGPAWRVVDRAVGDGVLGRSEVCWCGRASSMQVIRSVDREARIVLSWDEMQAGGDTPGQDQLDLLRPEAYNPHWPMIDAAAVHWAHQRELAVCCWTVDDADRMRRLIDLGVDAMISNDVRTLRAVIDSSGQPRDCS